MSTAAPPDTVARPEVENWQAAGFGLYLHWPFCDSKCPYCDFNSHVATAIDFGAWERAYLRELDRMAALTPGRVLSTVFFGGGTPSLMPAALVGRILERVAGLWVLSNDIEVTLEANPSSVEAERFAGFRSAGVNRVSLGVQALDDASLRRLGRRHSATEAIAAVELAQGCFDRVSFDLIYARQHQSLEDWRAELELAHALAGDHLSLYQLTIEDGTAFALRRAAGGLDGLPDDDRAADMYEWTRDRCRGAGLEAYEISNHARPGAESRHNLIYWRSGEWIGIGPGAHGRLGRDGRRFATEAIRAPQAWLAQVEQQGAGDLSMSPLLPDTVAAEYLMMGLRLREGVSVARWRRLGGRPGEGRLRDLEALGLLHRDGDRIAATDRGAVVLDAVLRQLLEA